MVIVYLWLALAAILALMLAAKLIIFIALAVKGAAIDWTGYNKGMITLTMIIFFPVVFIWGLLKVLMKSV
ncbi:MAG: hypothetical protein LBQ48_04965 [Oscillospiraceae bacterium]|jgi:hypothetical protein|nr:hypothetical protein [Oscillospiraceae bacterium]